MAIKTKTIAHSGAKAGLTESTEYPQAPVKEKGIKYSDKSAGQPELLPIFKTLKALLTPYEKGSIIASDQKDGIYNLTSRKVVEVAGKKMEELFFAGAIIQKGYVGFYYFPIYINGELKSDLSQELLKNLKGKTCFHIKKDDPDIYEHIKHALEIGYKFYEDNRWV